MFCTRCGNKFPEGGAFCTGCGSARGGSGGAHAMPTTNPYAPVQAMKANSKKIIIIAVAALLVTAAAVAIVVFGGGDGNQVQQFPQASAHHPIVGSWELVRANNVPDGVTSIDRMIFVHDGTFVFYFFQPVEGNQRWSGYWYISGPGRIAWYAPVYYQEGTDLGLDAITIYEGTEYEVTGNVLTIIHNRITSDYAVYRRIDHNNDRAQSSTTTPSGVFGRTFRGYASPLDSTNAFNITGVTIEIEFSGNRYTLMQEIGTRTRRIGSDAIWNIPAIVYVPIATDAEIEARIPITFHPPVPRLVSGYRIVSEGTFAVTEDQIEFVNADGDVFVYTLRHISADSIRIENILQIMWGGTTDWMPMGGDTGLSLGRNFDLTGSYPRWR